MKHVFVTLITVLILILCACNDSNKTKLHMICETTNKELPADLGVGVFESMTYNEDKNCVEMKVMLDEAVINIADLRKASEQQRDYLQYFMSQKENAELLKLLSETGSSVRLVMEGNRTKETTEITLSADDFENIKTTDDEDDNYRKQLDKIVASSNAQCPSDLGDGLVMSSVSLDNGYICYNFVYDPAQISFEDAESQDAWNNLFENLSGQAHTTGLSHTFDILRKLHCGIKYIYKSQDSSMPDKTITFSAEDVERM